MFESPLPADKAIEEADLVALIGAEARENRVLEFKREYLLQTDGGKRKFLQSITAFANARGGDLVLGMAEIDGVASVLTPLEAGQTHLNEMVGRWVGE